MTRKPLLRPEDLAAIESAVREAESRTSGEIYCVAAEESSDYGETPLAWGVGLAILAPAILLLTGVGVTVPPELAGLDWTATQLGRAAEAAAHEALWATLVLQAGLFALGALVAAPPAIRRRLTPRGLKRARVRRRAQEQFLAKNMHLTRERTGVLIFVSFGERMAELVADDGIAGQVEPAVWDRAMTALIDGLKRGEAAAGFAAAVGLCADVLAERFPSRPGDNPDEIPDAVAVLPRL